METIEPDSIDPSCSSDMMTRFSMDEAMMQGFGDEVVIVFSTVFLIFASLLFKIFVTSVLGSDNGGDGREITKPRTGSEIENDSAAESDREEEDEDEIDDTEIEIRLKYLDDTERHVECRLDTRLETFKETYFNEELDDGKVVRLIFSGRLLNENQKTLKRLGVSEPNSIIHVQISNPPPPQETDRNLNNENHGFEVNNATLSFPIYGVMLVLSWYIHYHFRELFTGAATTILLAISGLFCVFVFAPVQPVYVRHAEPQAPNL